MKRPGAPDPRLWLGFASLLILVCAPAQYFGRQHDDALFVIASHALARGTYRLFTSPGAPPLVHVWPGFPALLLPVTWIFDETPGAYQAFNALLLAACPWAIWAWLRRREGPLVALGIPLVFAASPLVLSQSGCVMPEAAYTLAATLLLVLLDRERPRGAAAALLAAAQLRSAGLSLLPAALAPSVRRRRWREAALIVGPAAAALLLWTWWSHAHAGYVQETREWIESYRAPGAARLLPLANARYYAATLGGCFLPPAWGGSVGAAALGAALLALAAAGAGAALRADASEPAAWMLASAAAMHLLWGWQYERYWIPLLPFALWALARGAGRRAPALLAALLAAQAVFHTHRWIRGTPYAAPELRASYAWLRGHSGPDDAIASALYARDGYYAGRPSLPLAEPGSAEGLAALLGRWRVRYVLWEDVDLGLSLGRAAGPNLALERVRGYLGEARFFKKVFMDPAAPAAVYEVRNIPSAAGKNRASDGR